jgi:hypothetical protein
MKTKLILILILAVIAIGAWYSIKGERNINGPTSADNAPSGSLHNLPVPEAVSKARQMAAQDLGVSEGVAIVQTAFEKEWSDSCLGLGGPAESCLMVITPGYEVTVSGNGKTVVYRTNQDGTVIRKEK